MGLFKKIFGGEGNEKSIDKSVEVIERTLEDVIDVSGLDLAFDIFETEEGVLTIELTGDDEPLLKERDGQLLDAFQFFIQRVLQNQLPEDRIKVVFDSNGFREEEDQSLIEMADRLKKIVLEKKKAIYCRALPPRGRKVIHRHLAEDRRVRSRSVGDRLYKKIRISLADERDDRGRSHRRNT